MSDNTIDAKRRRKDFQQFIRKNRVLPLSRKACAEAARIYADLRRKGKLISDADILIAGIARANECVLVTNNVDHFSPIKGLEVENWIQIS